MQLNKNMNILIVGLGLMGGSYAMALRRRGYKVYAITKDMSSIEYAKANGIIDDGTIEIDEAMIGCADIVIFALYPKIFVEWIKANQHCFKPGAVITDVTGVKGSVVYAVQDVLREDVEYIPAHPMAGREVYGVENSDDRIFWGANYIVTPTERNTEEAIELCAHLGEVLGFYNISVLTPSEHDDMIAFLSQLTHCIAVSLMCANDNPELVNYTGDSFRDLTRIAKINDEMWSELFLENKEALLLEMDNFKASFDKMYNAVNSGDREGLREMMRTSTVRRSLFDKKK